MGRNQPGKKRHDRHERRQRSTPAAPDVARAAAAVATASSSPAWLYPLLLALLGLGVYANSLAAPFHFDDWGFIVSEPGVKQLWPIEGHANRPVLTFSLALSNAVFGMQPLGFRLVNVVIHVLAGLLLFGSVRRILRQERFGFGQRAAAGFGFAVAALWLVHPLQTQAVTYIWQRSESLMGMFFFAALYALVRAATGSSARLWGLLILVFCLLGLGTKEVMVAVFPVLLLVDGVLLSSSLREALKKRWLLYGAFATLVAVLLVVVLPNTPTSMGKVTRLDYALSQPAVVLRYLRLALWPHPLSFDYGLRPASGVLGVWLPLSLVTGLLGATLFGLWRRSWLGVVGAWFFLVLAPTSSLIPINDLMVEYRMYVPLAALAVLAVAGGRLLCKRYRLPAGALLFVALLALGTAAIRRNADYLDNVTLWRAATEVSPQNPRAHLHLGTALLAEGRFAEARPVLERAVALDGKDFSIRWNLALALHNLGRPQDALEHYRVAVAKKPSAKHNAALGRALLESGHNERALKRFKRALKRQPHLRAALLGKARALENLGRERAAARVYREALRRSPEDAAGWKQLAELRMKLRQHTKAIRAYERALALEPEDALLMLDLARVHAGVGDKRAAVEYLERGLRQDPNTARSISELAALAARSSDAEFRAMALEVGELAVEASRRKEPDVLVNLARARAAAGHYEAARGLYREALELPRTPEHAELWSLYERELAALPGEQRQ